MSRRSTKKFEFGAGIYYFEINKGYQSNITIKRTTLEKALDAYRLYSKNQQKVSWLGKWDGKKFTENKIEELIKE